METIQAATSQLVSPTPQNYSISDILSDHPPFKVTGPIDQLIATTTTTTAAIIILIIIIIINQLFINTNIY